MHNKYIKPGSKYHRYMLMHIRQSFILLAVISKRQQTPLLVVIT